MNLGTKMQLIEESVEAINSGNYSDLIAAQNILKAICHQQQESWLMFVINEIVPALNERQTQEHTCRYCKTPFNNSYGLLAHLGKKHPDKKSEWSKASVQVANT